MKYILLSCSAGGHIFEMSQLLPALRNCEFIHITETSGANNGLGRLNYKLPYDGGINRIRSCFLVALGFFLSLYVFIRHRPYLHISLGSHVSIGPTIACWLTRVPTIHIESFTRVQSLSKSGKIILYFANQFYSQWPHLESINTKIKYNGALF